MRAFYKGSIKAVYRDHRHSPRYISHIFHRVNRIPRNTGPVSEPVDRYLEVGVAVVFGLRQAPCPKVHL